MTKKRTDNKTLEVGKNLTGDAILGNGNTIHKTSIQNYYFSDKHSSNTKNSRIPDKKAPSKKQLTSESEYSKAIKQNIKSITFNSALICDHIYPQIATRKAHAQLRGIEDRVGHVDKNPFFTANLARQRIDEFNLITGWEFTDDDIELIDFFLRYPEQLTVWFVFEQLYKDSSEKEWDIYEDCFEGRNHWEFNKSGEDVKKQINDWMQNKAEQIYKVVTKLLPDVPPKGHAIRPLEYYFGE